MGIKLQAFDDVLREVNQFFDKSIENVKNAEVGPEFKGFKRTVQQSLYDGRREGLEASKKAVNQIINRIQNEGGFR